MNPNRKSLLQFTADFKTIAEVDRLAEDMGESRSAMLRQLLRLGLEVYKAGPKLYELVGNEQAS
jgi:hypothetical protein